MLQNGVTSADYAFISSAAFLGENGIGSLYALYALKYMPDQAERMMADFNWDSSAYALHELSYRLAEYGETWQTAVADFESRRKAEQQALFAVMAWTVATSPASQGLKTPTNPQTSAEYLEATGVNTKTLHGSKTAMKNPLEGAVYTDKVINQMNNDAHHGFPRLVDEFGAYGNKTTIIGGDGVSRTKIEIPGYHHGNEGVYQYIIEPNGMINHRQFVLK